MSDLVSKAETEQSDYRRTTPVNVFFSPDKHYFGIKFTVYAWNTLVLVGSSCVLLGLLYTVLKRQLRPQGL